MRRPTPDRLRDIVDSIETAQQIRPATRAEFEANLIIQLALTRLVEIVGEAANHVGASIQAAHTEVPWRQIVGMRNRITHDYFEVDLEILWSVVTVELAALLPQVRSILAEVESSASAVD